MSTLFELYQKSLKNYHINERDEINIRVLLSSINGLNSMSNFYLRKNEPCKDENLYFEYLNRFLRGEPIQYILNSATFFAKDFYVDQRVLIPRMETEEVLTYFIDKLNQRFNTSPKILDLCSGSGCLGICAKSQFPNAKLWFSDISKDALEVAKINSTTFLVDADFLEGNCFEKVIEKSLKFDAVICNPPYITKKDDVDESVLRFEPHIALFADDDLTIYNNIFTNLDKVLEKDGFIVLEIGYDLKEKLEKMLNKLLPNCEYEFKKDINDKYRILYIKL